MNRFLLRVFLPCLVFIAHAQSQTSTEYATHINSVFANLDKAWQHKTGLYISHDAPHQGANIPLGIQHFARHMVSQFVSTPLGDMEISLGDGAPVSIEDIKSLFDAQATKQLLAQYLNSSASQIDNTR
ncbi:MAG TPA: hypothetical protein PLA69_05390 [Flavobacterium sp.]|nr:hypothetical protein [Flavobacterium sp.]